MSHYSNNRTKRFTVLTVLMVWMFALGVGWANACLVYEQGAESPVATDRDSAFLTVAPLASLDHDRGDSDHVGDLGNGTGAPVKVCDGGSDSIAKSSSGVGPTFPVMVPPMASKWAVKLAAATAVDVLPAVLAPSPHLPLRTRFSRLVL